LTAYTLKNKVAVVGVGETPYYKRGTSPDALRKLCLKAICAAADDAGIEPREIDGFASYGADTNEAPRLCGPLGTLEMRWASMVFGGGGGGNAAAIAMAASAIVSGQAETVVVYRASSEYQSGRLLRAVSEGAFGPNYLAHGMDASAHSLAIKTQRLLEHDGVPRSALRALAAASYYHARNNPRAVGQNTEFNDEIYDSSRWVIEPFHLFDCSRENDGCAAVILTSAERARDLTDTPAYLLSAAMGGPGPRWGELDENFEPYTSAGQAPLAKRMYAEAGVGPEDVDVAQVYINMTGAGVAAVIDHGFCTTEEAGEFFTLENLIAPDGRLPVNTSGGDLAESFVHGAGLALEAVRQIRGESTNQVPNCKISLLTGGPMSEFTSSALFGSDEALG
jgi:acetyl-CoA acetyltransferase